jgi:hypothetical protein
MRTKQNRMALWKWWWIGYTSWFFFRKIRMNLEIVVWTHWLKLACLQAIVGLSPRYAKSIVLCLGCSFVYSLVWNKCNYCTRYESLVLDVEALEVLCMHARCMVHGQVWVRRWFASCVASICLSVHGVHGVCHPNGEPLGAGGCNFQGTCSSPPWTKHLWLSVLVHWCALGMEGVCSRNADGTYNAVASFTCCWLNYIVGLLDRLEGAEKLSYQ